MRKRTTGRARSSTSLYVSIERTNKKLRQLKKGGKLGHYASKDLLRQLQQDNRVIISRNKKNILTIKTANLKSADIRYYKRALDTFRKNKSSSVMGIADIETRKRATLKNTLSQLTDADITDQDIEDFYDLVDNDDFRYFADKITDSIVYILIEEAKEKGASEETFINMLRGFMTINSEEVRAKASRLYKKWVL